jgi:hypothetical protein
MTGTAKIAATFPPDGLVSTAFNNGLLGASPGAVVRFLAYLAAGLDRDEARQRVAPQHVPLSDFEKRAFMEQVSLPRDIIDNIRDRHPGKSVSWALRYHMALVNGATDRQATIVANGFSAGRPVGSKDSKPRIRRTNAQIAAAQEAT